jgi:hypothetical protein
MAAILIAAQKRDGRFSYRCTFANDSSAKAQSDSIDTVSLRAPVRQCVGNRFGRRKKSTNRTGLSDPKKRIGRGLNIGRLRHSRPETNLAALKKKIAPSLATLQQMGFGAGKSPANRTRCSLSPYSAELASTDTKSNVSVAVSEERYCFATYSATDQRLVFARNIYSQSVKQGGGGSRTPAGGRLVDRISDTENFPQMRFPSSSTQTFKARFSTRARK